MRYACPWQVSKIALIYCTEGTIVITNLRSGVRFSILRFPFGFGGKRVKIKLLSGQDLDGKVAKVGTQAVVLSELGGMEFFDATLRLDQIAAVVVKARTK